MLFCRLEIVRQRLLQLVAVSVAFLIAALKKLASSYENWLRYYLTNLSNLSICYLIVVANSANLCIPILVMQ